MAKFIRYALAALFFAASVGSLALWRRSETTRDMLNGPSFLDAHRGLGFGAGQGTVTVSLGDAGSALVDPWEHWTTTISEPEREYRKQFVADHGRFTMMKYGGGTAIYFPLWYPALVSALAGVGVLRFRRQFSIRSALIGLGVVAALLAMAVTL